ncbi:MAG: sulfate ABC transporter permease subunit [Anaerolinea sp.]|nr:sulfate ABC transporter permease subunit [Anaerolinea sp.]
MRETESRSIWATLLILTVVIYAGALFVAPLFAMLQGALARGIEPLLAAFRDPDVLHAFQVTLILSLAAVAINALLGVTTAWVLVRHRFRGRKLFDTLVDIPFVFSPVIAGYAMIVLFGRDGWLAPPLVPIVFALPGILLAKIFVSLPFVTREVQPVLEALTPEPEDAAYTIGASHWTTFRRVILPEIWTALLYGVVLTFARAIGEFGAVAVVSGSIEGYTETATSFVFRALNDRNNIGGYGVSALLCVFSLVILIVMSLLRGQIIRQEA